MSRSEEELFLAYGGVRTGEELREAAARVARWTYVPSQPSKMLDLARDIAELRQALAAEIAADQVEAFPGLPVADDELDPQGAEIVRAAGVTAPPADLLHPDDGHPHSFGCRRCGVDAPPAEPRQRSRPMTDETRAEHHHQSFAARDACEECMSAIKAARAGATPPQRAVPEAASPTLRDRERFAAEAILDRRNADPDDDAAIVARAALRLASQPTPAPLDVERLYVRCRSCGELASNRIHNELGLAAYHEARI